MAMASRSRYATQLAETARLVAERVGAEDFELVYQSRSGPPQVPWLEPDVCDHIAGLPAQGVKDVVVSPIGFVSDHMEILFDLDVEAREAAAEAGLGFARAQTAGTHPAFVAMVRELVQERLDPAFPRRACGRFGPSHDICLAGCCLAG
jgi:ferrochelatase